MTDLSLADCVEGPGKHSSPTVTLAFYYTAYTALPPLFANNLSQQMIDLSLLTVSHYL
jgi:hypothetical protein